MRRGGKGCEEPPYPATCVNHPGITGLKGVGTAGATEALAAAMLKPRGRKYLFAPAIICQVYQLVDS